MLSTRVTPWPANSDWVIEPKWDGFRLLVAIDEQPESVHLGSISQSLLAGHGVTRVLSIGSGIGIA